MTFSTLTTRALVLVVSGLAATVWSAPNRKPKNEAAERAQALAVEARGAFNDGRFAAAAELLEQAYALQPAPNLLYNVGRAHQQAGQKQKAIDAYERYLAASPDAKDANAIRSSIRQLRDELDAEVALAERARVEKARADQEAAERARVLAEKAIVEQQVARRPSAWPWVIAGIGAAGIGVGTATGLMSSSSYRQAVAEPEVVAAQQLHGRATTFATVANISFLAGGVIALGAAIWGAFDLISSRRVQVSVLLGASQANLLVIW